MTPAPRTSREAPLLRAITALLHTDLRQLLRSRRALVMAVFVPILVWPTTFLITQRVAAKQQERLEATVYRWAVTGPEADSLRRLVEEAEAAGPGEAAGLRDGAAGVRARGGRFRASGLPSGDRRRLAPPLRRSAARGHADHGPRPGPRRSAAQKCRDATKGGRGAGAGCRSAARRCRGAAEDQPDPPAPSPVPVYRVHYREDRDLSREALERLDGALATGQRPAPRSASCSGAAFPPVPPSWARSRPRTWPATPQSTGLQLGRFISALLVSLLLAGGSVVASDSLAGEKERGTLETLLTTAVSRAEIVIAKQLSILTWWRWE